MRNWERPSWTSRARRLLSRAGDLILRRRRDRDLDEEIAAHLELAAEDQRAKGLSEDDARAKAARNFGGILRAKEAYRDGRGFAWIDVVLQDSRFALRSFRKTPTFTAVAILTLALAIGANTAIFSVVYGALIKPLPYRDADRLVLIQSHYQLAGSDGEWLLELPAAARDELRMRLQTVDDLALFTENTYALSRTTGAEIVHTAEVSDNFFSTMDGRLIAGRGLGPADASTPAVVISARLARRLFDEPRAAIGAHLTLTAHSYVVVGVADESFRFPSRTTDLWMPAEYTQTVRLREEPGTFHPIARLKPGVDLDRARADIGVAMASFASSQRQSFARGVRTSIVSLRDYEVGAVRPLLMILWAAVGLVLLIACANLANLLLARATARSQETVLRIALGASRGRLLAKSLIDSAVLGLTGTATGVVLAEGALVVLGRLAPENLPWLRQIDLSWPVLAFAILLGILTVVCIGVLPALQSSPTSIMRRTGVPAGAPSGRRLRRVLCGVELAAAIVLLIGATLLGRSLVALLRTDIGVNPDRVTTASIDLELTQRPFNTHTREIVARVLSRLDAVPGVRAAGVGTSLPPDFGRMMTMLTRKSDGARLPATIVTATPGYFQALGVRLLEGRLFTEADDASHPQAMIMGVSTARRFFGDGDIVGRTASVPMPAHDGLKAGPVDMTLVGIVSDVKYGGLAAAAPPQVYRPFAQQPWPAISLVVRTDRDFIDFPETLRRAIAAVDPTIVVSVIQPLDARVATDVAPSQFRTALLVSFAGLALLIASIGLYGVIAYSVAQRTMEIGIRMALGARAEDVTRMVLREGVLIGLAGAATGLVAAYGATRLLTSLLYGVAATDPISFALAAVILLAVALAASYVPARRAAQIDPLVALRTE
jgi:predicted permease